MNEHCSSWIVKWQSKAMAMKRRLHTSAHNSLLLQISYRRKTNTLFFHFHYFTTTSSSTLSTWSYPQHPWFSFSGESTEATVYEDTDFLMLVSYLYMSDAPSSIFIFYITCLSRNNCCSSFLSSLWICTFILSPSRSSTQQCWRCRCLRRYAFTW